MSTVALLIGVALGVPAGYAFGRSQHHSWMAKSFQMLADISRLRKVTDEDVVAAFGRRYPR